MADLYASGTSYIRHVPSHTPSRLAAMGPSSWAKWTRMPPCSTQSAPFVNPRDLGYLFYTTTKQKEPNINVLILPSQNKNGTRRVLAVVVRIKQTMSCCLRGSSESVISFDSLRIRFHSVLCYLEPRLLGTYHRPSLYRNDWVGSDCCLITFSFVPVVPVVPTPGPAFQTVGATIGLPRAIHCSHHLRTSSEPHEPTLPPTRRRWK